MTAKSTLLKDVMTHGVKNGTGPFASIGFKEAAPLSKPVNFYISKGWMTAQIAIEAEAEPGTGAPIAAAVEMIPGDLSQVGFHSMV